MLSSRTRLRVAHYYPWAYLTSGIERVLLQTCRGSRNDNTIFTNHFDAAHTYPELAQVPRVELRRVSVRRCLSAVGRAAAVLATQHLPLEGFDALVVHSDGLGDLVLARNGRPPTLCYCHTPLRPVFDPEYRRRALSRFHGARRVAFRVLAAGFRAVDRALWRQYQHVMFNSRETLNRARAGGLIPNGRSTWQILHPGVDLAGLTPIWRFSRYFLVAGRIMWTKNIELAVAAFELFRESSAAAADFRLVVAGAVDEKSRPYLAHLQEMSSRIPGIEFVVSPSDARLRSLYANCYAVLFPSFNEDWGLVPLEANAYGKPVIATNAGGPAESQADGVSGFLVPPAARAFADKMAHLAADAGRVLTLGRQARAHAEQFDAARFVEQFDEAVECVALGVAPPAPEPPAGSPFDLTAA